MLPGLTVVGGVVVMHGPPLRVMRDALLIAARSRHRNGLPVSAHHAAILDAVTAAMSATGQTDDRETAALQSHSHELPTVPLAEAARRLGYSQRHTRRLAHRLGGQRIAGRWLLDDQAITEHIEGRQ